MVPTSNFQRRAAGLQASPGVAHRSRQRAGALPVFTLDESTSAGSRRGMALAMIPLNQSGVSA